MKEEGVKEEPVSLLLLEFYENVDEIFLGYFISLSAPQAWNLKLSQYVKEYKDLWVSEIGVSDVEAEKRVEEADHIFGDGEFRIHTTTSKLRKILLPGVFEDLQAKNAIKIIYDSWEDTYRPKLEDLIDQKIQGDIWGDLRYLRHSIAHRDSKGVEDIKKAKIIKNFAPGQKIILTREIMAKIQLEIEEWYTEFLMKYAAPKIGTAICRNPIPSGRARTYGLSDLKSFVERKKSDFGFLPKENPDPFSSLFGEIHE